MSLEADALSWRPDSASTTAPLSSTQRVHLGNNYNDSRYDNCTSPQQHASIPKIMTQLLAIPTNRSCADCKSALVDTSQIYASYSPSVTVTTSTNESSNDRNPFNDIPPTRKEQLKKKHFDNKTKTFHQNHEAFMPTFPDVVFSAATESGLFQYVNKIPALQESDDMMVDPAITAASICYHSHGVFVCSLCGAAHKLLKHTTTIVKSVMDVASWTQDGTSSDIQIIMNAGGNVRANAILEAYYNVSNMNINNNNNSNGGSGGIIIPRPTSNSTIVDRLIFIRAKYEALAFLLPSSSSSTASSGAAWQNIVNFHPEWDGLWGANLRQQISDFEYLQSSPDDTSNTGFTNSLWQTTNVSTMTPTTKNNSTYSGKAPTTTATATMLPNRLIDYFCVVTASDFLHPSILQKDLSSVSRSPEDIMLTPTVTDCIPLPDSYNVDESMPCENNTFPEHISTFVYPDGCTPSLMQLPPLFFTAVLTNSSGERLYGGILRLYDDNFDTIETITRILQSSKYPSHQYPLWLPQTYRSSSLPNGQRKQKTGEMNLVQSNEDISGTATAMQLTSDVMFLPKSLVIISHYPFFDIFRKFLLQLYRIALTESPLPIERFVTNFVCEVPLPPPGKIQVKFGFTINDCWTIERPPENQLPLANFSYRPLFTCLSVPNVLVVMGCLLQEIRIVLVSKHYALLVPVSEALLSLLFPFHWQGMYLPVLPYNMLEILEAPVPYLVGLHSRYVNEVAIENRPKGVVIVDLDKDEVHLGFDDQSDAGPRHLPSLPDRHTMKLRAKLLEFAASVYVLPNTQRMGYVSTANGVEVPSSNRDQYAQTNEIPINDEIRRRDILPLTDKAFSDNELLVPISGFLSEQGQLYQQQDKNFHLTDKKSPKFQFKIRLLRSPSEGGDNTLSQHDHQEERDIENLLDVKDPPGFKADEIRQAFLRFFTSLFQMYRTYIVDGSDSDKFRSEDFLTGLNLSESSKDCVREILSTQMFHNFIEERRENPNDPEVLFFDDTINAKFNRSRKVVLTGRKKETAFLDDTRSMITETYTPPPPSNFGLPDDGRSYQYSTFPKLDSKLYGKIRTPITWQDQNRRDLLRASGRRSSIAALRSEQALVAKASRSVLPYKSKKMIRNLEGALRILSSPFNGIPKRSAQETGYRRNQDISTVERDRGSSVISNVTIPSEFDSTTDMELTSAEEIVLNARRKQAILISIIAKFQVQCRWHLKRKRFRERMQKLNWTSQEESEDKHEFAATFIQYWFRSFLIRQEYLRKKKVVLFLQAQKRGMKIRLAYQLLLYSVTHLQAVCRGFVARCIIVDLATDRMNTYKKQIFALWNISSTPLCYRTQFWPILNAYTFLRLSVAEQELVRLWTDLKIQVQYERYCNAIASTRAGVILGSVHGTSYGIHSNALKVDVSALSASISMAQSGKRKSMVNVGAYRYQDRVAAERTQFYERLSMLTQDVMMKILSRYAIPLSDKRKKTSLTEELWLNYKEADQSAALMTEIFPELMHSTDIHIMLPSKKALRRFPCTTVLPQPLPASLNAQQLLSDRIRRNTVEIANLAMCRVPAQLIELDRRLESKLLKRRADEANLQSRTLTNATRRRQNVSESDTRVAIIQHALHMKNRVSSTSATKSFEQAWLSHHSLKESNTGGGALDSINEISENLASNPFNGKNTNRTDDRSINEHAQQPTHSQTTKGRFSFKLSWSQVSIGRPV